VDTRMHDTYMYDHHDEHMNGVSWVSSGAAKSPTEAWMHGYARLPIIAASCIHQLRLK
jgi:hypothetical protein